MIIRLRFIPFILIINHSSHMMHFLYIYIYIYIYSTHDSYDSYILGRDPPYDEAGGSLPKKF